MAHMPMGQHAQAYPPVSSSAGANTARKDHATNFWDNYEHMCAVYNQMPLQTLKAVAMEGGAILDLNADKLKSADWEPLLGAVKTCKAIRKIALKSAYIGPNESESDAKNSKRPGAAKVRKVPAIRTKERVHKLCRGLKDCLSISQFLDHLEVFNIPLTTKDLSSLAKGLAVNKTLKTLSLDTCLIGDDGLSIVCESIQRLTNLNRVNFSACNLTKMGASILAKLIIFQAMKRHDEAWKASLRYGRPDLDSMCGIRRITINSNPLIGDEGVRELADAFKADLWLKALDMQDCGITTKGAECLLEGLKFNAMMHVLDVRLNPQISRDKLQKIMEQVMINSSGNSTEYEWMDLAQTAAAAAAVSKAASSSSSASASHHHHHHHAPPQNGGDMSGQKLKKRRATNASFSKKLQFAATSSIKMKRCKSTGSVVCGGGGGSGETPNKQLAHSSNHQLQNSGGGGASGVPWRAAARAEKYRVGDTCAYRRVASPSYNNNEGSDDQFDQDEDDGDGDDDDEFELLAAEQPKRQQRMTAASARPLVNPPGADHLMMASSTFDYDKFAATTAPSFKARKPDLTASEFASNLDKIRNVSVKDLLVILQKEQESKTHLEDMLLELQNENTKLKGQIASMKAKMERGGGGGGGNMSRSYLDDDKAVEIIELTLYKFQSFLDFLRDRGFGKLIEIGGMSNQQQQQHHDSAELEKQKSRVNTVEAQSPEDYYLNKISRTKAKMARQQPSRSSFLHGHGDHDHGGIDSLVTNALEITHTFKRQNSTMLNASEQPSRRQVMLDQIEETNKENSHSSSGGGASKLADHSSSNRKLRPSNTSNASSVSTQSKLGSPESVKPATLPRTHTLEAQPKAVQQAQPEELSEIDGASEYSDEEEEEEDYEEEDEEVAKIQKLTLASPPEKEETRVLKFQTAAAGDDDEIEEEMSQGQEDDEDDF